METDPKESDPKPTTIVEIYGTLSHIPPGGTYIDAEPDIFAIQNYNGMFLKDEATIIYATCLAGLNRGTVREQLDRWGCMYHQLQLPAYGFSSATTMNIPTAYGHRFGFDPYTCVHVFSSTQEVPSKAGSVLGPRRHIYKENHFYVLHGRIRYGWIEPITGQVFLEILEAGSMVKSTIGVSYMLESLDGAASVLQRSTHAEEVDNHEPL
jgi:hypothetical protein